VKRAHFAKGHQKAQFSKGASEGTRRAQFSKGASEDARRAQFAKGDITKIFAQPPLNGQLLKRIKQTEYINFGRYRCCAG
jgi:hypothetical protein